MSLRGLFVPHLIPAGMIPEEEEAELEEKKQQQVVLSSEEEKRVESLESGGPPIDDVAAAKAKAKQFESTTLQDAAVRNQAFVDAAEEEG